MRFRIEDTQARCRLPLFLTQYLTNQEYDAMPIRGSATQAFRREHRQKARPLQEDRKRILADPNYTKTERARALAPIEEKLRALFDEYRADIRKQVDHATAHHLKNRPRNKQLEAAFKNPARAVAMRQLADGQAAPVKQFLAELAAEEQDAAAAFGIIQSLAVGEISAEVAGRLSSVGASESEGAIADLVATLSEASRFEMEGPFGDVTENPVAALEYANAARALPDSSGQAINLSDEQVARYREAAGLFPEMGY